MTKKERNRREWQERERNLARFAREHWDRILALNYARIRGEAG